MKKLILAACVVAVGLPAWAQGQPAPKAQPPRPGIDYGYYGGPSNAPSQTSAPSQSQAPGPRVRYHQGTTGAYEMYGVPDDLTMAEQEQQRIRDAAVEFGRFRRQFTGSTQFWMDQHRTELAHSRYAMDEPMWRSLHPAFEFGDGGYLYDTAVNVGAPVMWTAPRIAQTAVPATAPLVNAVPAETAPATTPVPVARPNRSTAPPRVIAGSKPVYDAAAAVGAQPSH
jgi:hypothetical protein